MSTFTKEKIIFIIKWILGLKELSIKERNLLQAQLLEFFQTNENDNELLLFRKKIKSNLDKIEKENLNLLPNIKAEKIKSVITDNLTLIKKEELKPELQNYEEKIQEKSTLFDAAGFL